MIDRSLAVSEESDDGAAAVSDIDAVDIAIVVDDGLHRSLPEDGRIVVAADLAGGVGAATAGFHAEEMGVFHLHKEAGALAEVAPDGVADYVEAGCAAGFEDLGAGFEL